GMPAYFFLGNAYLRDHSSGARQCTPKSRYPHRPAPGLPVEEGGEDFPVGRRRIPEGVVFEPVRRCRPPSTSVSAGSLAAADSWEANPAYPMAQGHFVARIMLEDSLRRGPAHGRPATVDGLLAEIPERQRARLQWLQLLRRRIGKRNPDAVVTATR